MKWIVLLPVLIGFLFGCSTTEEQIEGIATQTLKASLHDPNSLEIISIETLNIAAYLKEITPLQKSATARLNASYVERAFAMDNKRKPILVHIRFRAKNGFGAVRKDEAKMIMGNITSPTAKFGILLKQEQGK